MDYGWEEYPVIHIDFARTDLSTQDTCTESLKNMLCQVAEDYEVEWSFKENLVSAYMGKDPVTFGRKLRKSAREGDTGEMIELLTSYFAGFPYDIQIKAEKYYRSMVRVIFEMCGMEFLTEEKFFA